MCGVRGVAPCRYRYVLFVVVVVVVVVIRVGRGRSAVFCGERGDVYLKILLFTFVNEAMEEKGKCRVRWVKTEDEHHARRTFGNVTSSSTERL